MARRLRLELLEDRRLLTSLAGYVYNDVNNDGVMQTGESGIRNAKVTLTGTDDIHGDVRMSVLTDSTGAYAFSLGSGTYRITVGDPSGYVGGTPSVGSQEAGITDYGTDASGDNLFIDQITLDTGVDGINNNFGELTAASVAGTIWDDSANNDGVKQAGEPALAGIMVHFSGTDDRANDVNMTATTGASGTFAFSELRPGSYTLTHDQPTGYLAGKVVAGNEPNVVATQPTLQGGQGQIAFSLDPGDNGTGNNFAELKVASLAGFVWDDSANNDGIKQTGESGIQGVSVTLSGTTDLGVIFPVSVATAADGSYSFPNLRPGTYTLAETQPFSYLDGKDTIGTPSGTAGNDQFAGIVLAVGANGANNNFGELRPASLSGFVWDDTANNDGVKQTGEAGISGATVHLTGTDDLGHAVNRAATTDTAGAYNFSSLRPGTYALAEDQPAGYADGKDTIGTPGGTAGNDQFTGIVLAAGVAGANNNFGERFLAVAYTLVVKGPSGTVARQDSLGRYRLNPGDSFTVEVRANDVRSGVGANGGVQAAYADLRYDPSLLNWTAGSLQIAALFDKSTAGTIDAAHQLVDEAGGAFDLALNGSHYPGAGTPQLLFTVAGQVSAAATHGSTVTLALDSADVAGHDTMVFGNSASVPATYQGVGLLIGSLWRNPTNQWDVDGNGTVNAADESTVVSQLTAGKPQVLADIRPTGSPMVDVDGNGVLNWLDALLIHQHLGSASAGVQMAVAASSPSPSVTATTTAASPPTGTAPGREDQAAAAYSPQLLTALFTMAQREGPRQAVLDQVFAGEADDSHSFLQRRTADYAPLENFSTKPKGHFGDL